MDEQELLRTVPIFAELSDADIASLSRLATRRRYPKDTVVFFENEEGDFFFMILEGRIKVTILGDDGREVILSILGPGGCRDSIVTLLMTSAARSARVIVGDDGMRRYSSGIWSSSRASRASRDRRRASSSRGSRASMRR